MSSSLSSITGQGRLTSRNQNNPLTQKVGDSHRVQCAVIQTDGYHPEIAALREELALHGATVLPLLACYYVFNFWCHGRQPGHHSTELEGIDGIQGTQPCYVYIVQFSPQESAQNKARVLQYGELVRQYCGYRQLAQADRSGRIEFVQGNADYSETNLHHFIRTLGYAVVRAKTEYIFYEASQGQGFKSVVYECVFAVNKEGLNVKQLPDYSQVGDTPGGVILEYNQRSSRGVSYCTGRKVIVQAPYLSEKNKSTCREIINKFTPDTRIHQYAQDYLLKNTWRPAVVTLTDRDSSEEIYANYAYDATASAAVQPQQGSRAAQHAAQFQPEPEAEFAQKRAQEEDEKKEETKEVIIDCTEPYYENYFNGNCFDLTQADFDQLPTPHSSPDCNALSSPDHNALSSPDSSDSDLDSYDSDGSHRFKYCGGKHGKTFSYGQNKRSRK